MSVVVSEFWETRHFSCVCSLWVHTGLRISLIQWYVSLCGCVRCTSIWVCSQRAGVSLRANWVKLRPSLSPNVIKCLFSASSAESFMQGQKTMMQILLVNNSMLCPVDMVMCAKQSYLLHLSCKNTQTQTPLADWVEMSVKCLMYTHTHTHTHTHRHSDGTAWLCFYFFSLNLIKYSIVMHGH